MPAAFRRACARGFHASGHGRGQTKFLALLFPRKSPVQPTGRGGW